tara:strand:- start:26680 stop:27267 length:588 start_codon:yes stop_codon:yes gene_type:complete
MVNPVQDKELVIFDLDGTLADTTLAAVAAINSRCKSIGINLAQSDITAALRHGTGAINQLLLRQNLSPIDIKRIVLESKLLSATEAIRPYYLSNIESALTKWGVTTAIVTNRSREHTQLIFDRINLSLPLLRVVITSDDAPKKPSPTGILLAIFNSKVAREKAVYIGDSNKDVAAARNAGVYYLNVTEILDSCIV